MATVLVIGDTHCPGMRRGYVDFLKRIADDYQPNRIVHIGDLVDWTSISYHETHTTLRDSSKEYRKARRQVKIISDAFPKVDWMLGNHDVLTSRQAVTAGLPEEIFKSYTEMWDLPKWRAHPRYSHLKIDGVLYGHGEVGSGGQYAAFNQAKQNFRSTVIGHFHSQAGVLCWANPGKLVFGMSVGCGIDRDQLAFQYGRKLKPSPFWAAES